MNFTIITPTREQMLAYGWQAFIPPNERRKRWDGRRETLLDSQAFMRSLEHAVCEHFHLPYGMMFPEVIAKIEALGETAGSMKAKQIVGVIL